MMALHHVVIAQAHIIIVNKITAMMIVDRCRHLVPHLAERRTSPIATSSTTARRSDAIIYGKEKAL